MGILYIIFPKKARGIDKQYFTVVLFQCQKNQGGIAVTKEEFKEMCQSHGLTPVSDTRCVGWERGYFVSVQYAGKNTVGVNLLTGKDDEKKYVKDLKRELKERLGKAASLGWSDDVLTLFISSKKIPDVYCQGVTAALDVLRGLGISSPDACKVCGKSGCDAAVPKGAAYAPVHRACLEGAVSGAQTKADANIASGSYVLGCAGAFLGMLVGILPTVFSILALQRIYVLLFMLIPLASYAGYRLLKGKMNYAALVLSILFSILGVFLLNFINAIWSVKDYYDFTFGETLSLIGPAFTDKTVWTEIVKDENFFKCLLFVALGIFLAWGQISRTSRSDVKDAQGVLTAAIPYRCPTQGLEYDPADYMPDTDSHEE